MIKIIGLNAMINLQHPIDLLELVLLYFNN